MLAMSQSPPTGPPANLSPREAWERYLERRRSESTEHSQKTYHYRLKLFVEWCEERGLDRVADFTGWTFEEYETHRSGADIEPITLKGEMQTLKNFVEYLERIEAVDDGLSRKVHVPNVSDSEASSDVQLLPEDAMALLQTFRSTPAANGTRRHALLELLWFTGARMGGVRALDLQDYYSEKRFVEFVHRPRTGTPLKNDKDGERPIGLPKQVCDVIDRYLKMHRREQSDEHDRQPLFTTRVGRMARSTIRADCYMATFPCHHSPCPHGKDPENCVYKVRDSASRCPSSRSPHQVRTGSIRWQFDIGIPPSVVAERVNASLDVIKKHYDKATPREQMESRRRRFVEQMGLSLEPIGDKDHSDQSDQ